ncbi:MAG: Zn-ribbon domain-containing OB-fold protein [Comamonadaceae bacterium]|nr:Zn-ribbon domain-containing OB-fold protein [Comamonadaceae bacterium]
MFQRCSTCGKSQFYPRSLCRHCRARELKWEQSKGLGKVASYSVVHRAPTPAFRTNSPYVLALIDMDEGFRFMCNVIHCDPASVGIGDTVRVVYESRPGSTQKIPQVEKI